MKYIILILSCLFWSTSYFAQLTSDNYWQLKKELAAKINQLRKEKQAGALVFDKTLEQAAYLHSSFMALNRVLRHDEIDPKKGTPKARVLYCGGKDFELVGENVLQSVPLTFPLSKTDISKLADDFFLAWKKSPGHYANMINKEYQLADFGFVLDSVNSVIYATHLFGKKGVLIPHQLSENGFGLKIAKSDCAKEMDGYMNLVYNLGNAIHIEGDEVWFYESNKALFSTVFSGPKDGLAIDLINRKQLRCGKANSLDMSPVYDGVLCKPIYRDEILKNNVAQSDYRIAVKLADVPAHLTSEELSPSILLIKGGEVCLYLTAGDLESDQFELITAKPKIKEPENRTLEHQGIVQSVTVEYDFRPKDSIPKNYPAVPHLGRKVHSVYIQSYSSVDGDSLSNAYYHYMRAQKIRAHLQKELLIPDSKIQMDYKENWSLMDYQLRYYLLDDLLRMNHDQVRTNYKTHPEIQWQRLFAQQRRSCATINFEATLPANTSETLLAETNLRTALINRDWELANAALAKLYFKQKIPGFIFEIPFYDILKDEPALTQNVAALYTLMKDPYCKEVNLFLMECLQRLPTLDQETRENLVILYARISFERLKEWDLPAQQLARIADPRRVLAMTANRQFAPETMVNMHLTFINYFGQVNDAKNISKSFNYIDSYFQKKTLSLEDNIKLVKFYNHWSRYDLTIDRLKPLYLQKKLNKEGLFILTKACVFYKSGTDVPFTMELIKAASVYKNDWCKWIHNEFQLLREEETKALYCKLCGQ